MTDILKAGKDSMLKVRFNTKRWKATVEKFTASQNNLLKDLTKSVDRVTALERDKADLLRQRRLDAMAAK
jgi:hypothetical protein